MLEISQVELCARASVGRNLLNDFETGARVPRASNLARIRAALEAAGARFEDFDDGTICVRVVPPAAGSASG